VINLTFDGSTTATASGHNSVATTSKTYTLKCNSSTQSITITAPITGKDYVVTVRNPSGNVVGTAATNGGSAGSASFVPGLTDMVNGATYTISVSVAARNSDKSNSFSATFTVQ
jgi:hypothetical protein